MKKRRDKVILETVRPKCQALPQLEVQKPVSYASCFVDTDLDYHLNFVKSNHAFYALSWAHPPYFPNAPDAF